MTALERSTVPGIEPAYRGKVRDIYDLGSQLLLVATDRISAYDVILPQPIPEKGAILTSISAFWFDHFGASVENHRISVDAADLPEPYRTAAQEWGPRFMLTEKLEMFPVECVVRGYLAGSGWKDYQRDGVVSGVRLPEGLAQCEELADPIFTPSTKAESGHDEPISKARAADLVGHEVIDELERLSLLVYSQARAFARDRGVILADTKFEFGHRPGVEAPILADEVLTPDSSRYWPVDGYEAGHDQPSFDKQYVRNFLTSIGWQGDGPAPDLPNEVIAGTLSRYTEIYRRITGREWKSSGA